MLTGGADEQVEQARAWLDRRLAAVLVPSGYLHVCTMIECALAHLFSCLGACVACV